MLEPKLDRRIQRTQRLLRDALIALALEKGYDAITIRDLTERANVSYSTFFRHYFEKDDLLAQEVKGVIQNMQTLINQTDARSRDAEGRLIFQHVVANEAFFRVLFSSYGASRVIQNIQREIVDHLVQTLVFDPDSPIPPEIAANHFVATILTLIRWWLEHNMPYGVEQMASIYSQLLTDGLKRSFTPA